MDQQHQWGGGDVRSAAGVAFGGYCGGRFGWFLDVHTAGGFVGEDSFRYTVTDGGFTSGEATLTFRVTNQAPVAGAVGPFTVLPGQALAINVLGAASDDDGDSLQPVLLQYPAHGTLLVDASGVLHDEAFADYAGNDQFVYAVSDGLSLSQPVTASVTVSSSLEVVANPIYISGVAGAPLIFEDNLIWGSIQSIGRLQGEVLSYSQPAYGTLVRDERSRRWNYAPGQNSIHPDQAIITVRIGNSLLTTSLFIAQVPAPQGNQVPAGINLQTVGRVFLVGREVVSHSGHYHYTIVVMSVVEVNGQQFGHHWVTYEGAGDTSPWFLDNRNHRPIPKRNHPESLLFLRDQFLPRNARNTDIPIRNLLNNPHVYEIEPRRARGNRSIIHIFYEQSRYLEYAFQNTEQLDYHLWRLNSNTYTSVLLGRLRWRVCRQLGQSNERLIVQPFGGTAWAPRAQAYRQQQGPNFDLDDPPDDFRPPLADLLRWGLQPSQEARGFQRGPVIRIPPVPGVRPPEER